MQITIRGKNIEVTPALRQHVERKIGKIGRYFETPLTAQVTLIVEKDRHIVEVTVPLDGMLLRGEDETDDMYASIDSVVDKLERQIRKYKTRVNRRVRRTEGKPLFVSSPDEEAVEYEEGRVVKTKRFAVKPMDVEEAILQMNLLDHDFFVFANAETQEVNVLYKRKDGNYGLIEPNL